MHRVASNWASEVTKISNHCLHPCWCHHHHDVPTNDPTTDGTNQNHPTADPTDPTDNPTADPTDPTDNPMDPTDENKLIFCNMDANHHDIYFSWQE